MADDADNAQRHIEAEMAGLLARRRTEAPAATGFCLNCGAVVEPPRRWCDADCRDDWQREHGR
jgi:uncharacterized OB-fold protein